MNKSMETIPAQFDEVLKETAIVSVLKAYIKFLCVKGYKAEDIANEVNKAASCALDKGDLTQNTLGLVNHMIEECAKSDIEDKLTEKFVEHALGCTAGKLVESMGYASAPEFECFAKVAELKKAYKDAVAQVVASYGEAIKNHAKTFFAQNANLFNAEFGKFFE